MRGSVTRLRRRLDASLSRVAFGNLAGFSNNADGIVRMGIRRALEFLPNAEAVSAEARKLRADGFFAFPKPCEAQTIAAVTHKFNAAIEDDALSVGRASAAARHRGHFYSRALRDARILLPELAEMIDDDVARLLTEFYGGPFRVRDFIAWRNYSPPRDVSDEFEVYSDRWHCDRIRGGILKYFVVLHDVDETRGPMQIQSRQRTRELLRMGFRERDDYGLSKEEIEDPSNVFKFTGPAGARALVSTVRCLHRAGHPEPGKFRDIVQIQFQPSERPFERTELMQTVPVDPDKLQLMKGGVTVPPPVTTSSQ